MPIGGGDRLPAGGEWAVPEDIARVVISPPTAKTHITRAISKLRVRGPVHLVILAYGDGLVGPLT